MSSTLTRGQTSPPPMMTCGHAANAKRPDGSPACAVCMCDTIAPTTPDLTGRTARCTYHGAKCTSEMPSALGLAFFEYRGPGSRRAETLCANCGMILSAHWPEFDVTLRVTFTDNTGRDMTRRLRAQDARLANGAAGVWAETLRAAPDFLTGKAYRSIVLASIVEIPSARNCTIFCALGGQPFDAYYCGCYGWD